jgi:hypothetical protein
VKVVVVVGGGGHGDGGGGGSAVDLCNVLGHSDMAILNLKAVKECLPLNFMPIKFKQLRTDKQ